MSTALVSATRSALLVGAFLACWALSASGCGGQSVQDEGSSGGAGESGGADSDGVGGSSSTGGSTNTGGASGSGGASASGGAGGVDNGCNLDTIECPEGSAVCECPGVFQDCPYANIRCDADADGEPRNCTCGEPDVRADDCDYRIQYRCEPLNEPWPQLDTCTCDPVLPSDDEPCRYFQEAYDAAGLDRTCTMLTNEIESEEKYKYTCQCSE